MGSTERRVREMRVDSSSSSSSEVRNPESVSQ